MPNLTPHDHEEFRARKVITKAMYTICKLPSYETIVSGKTPDDAYRQFLNRMAAIYGESAKIEIVQNFITTNDKDMILEVDGTKYLLYENHNSYYDDYYGRNDYEEDRWNDRYGYDSYYSGGGWNDPYEDEYYDSYTGYSYRRRLREPYYEDYIPWVPSIQKADRNNTWYLGALEIFNGISI